MKLVFRGGLWDGVEMETRFAPQEILLNGVIIDDEAQEENLMPSCGLEFPKRIGDRRRPPT